MEATIETQRPDLKKFCKTIFQVLTSAPLLVLLLIAGTITAILASAIHSNLNFWKGFWYGLLAAFIGLIMCGIFIKKIYTWWDNKFETNHLQDYKTLKRTYEHKEARPLTRVEMIMVILPFVISLLIGSCCFSSTADYKAYLINGKPVAYGTTELALPMLNDIHYVMVQQDQYLQNVVATTATGAQVVATISASLKLSDDTSTWRSNEEMKTALQEALMESFRKVIKKRSPEELKESLIIEIDLGSSNSFKHLGAKWNGSLSIRDLKAYFKE